MLVLVRASIRCAEQPAGNLWQHVCLCVRAAFSREILLNIQVVQSPYKMHVHLVRCHGEIGKSAGLARACTDTHTHAHSNIFIRSFRLESIRHCIFWCVYYDLQRWAHSYCHQNFLLRARMFVCRLCVHAKLSLEIARFCWIRLAYCTIAPVQDAFAFHPRCESSAACHISPWRAIAFHSVRVRIRSELALMRINLEYI